MKRLKNLGRVVPKSSKSHKMLSSIWFKSKMLPSLSFMFHHFPIIFPSFSHHFPIIVHRFSPGHWRPIPIFDAKSLAWVHGSDGWRAPQAPHSSGHSSSFNMDRWGPLVQQVLSARHGPGLARILLALNDVGTCWEMVNPWEVCWNEGSSVHHSPTAGSSVKASLPKFSLLVWGAPFFEVRIGCKLHFSRSWADKHHQFGSSWKTQAWFPKSKSPALQCQPRIYNPGWLELI